MCVLTRGGPMSFLGGYYSLLSHVLSRGSTPVLARAGSTLVPGQGYPPHRPGQDWGTPCSPGGTGVPPCPIQDWGTPWPIQDWGTPRDWLRRWRYATCGFPQEDFLFLNFLQNARSGGFSDQIVDIL